MWLWIGKASDCSPSWESLSKLTIVNIGEEVGRMDHSVCTLAFMPQKGLTLLMAQLVRSRPVTQRLC